MDMTLYLPFDALTLYYFVGSQNLLGTIPSSAYGRLEQKKCCDLAVTEVCLQQMYLQVGV